MELKKTIDSRSNDTSVSQKLKQQDNINHLISALQTTIILDELVPLFSNELLKAVDHSGVIFENPELGIVFQHGSRTNHSCEYSLTIENNSLGKLTFMRRQRFNESELNTIEQFLSVLLYPLKNTLLYSQAIQFAHTDPLTGVLNRSTLRSVFQKEVSLTKRHHSDLSLIMLDLDFFKTVNDRYGHCAGDTALKDVTQCIEKTLRESDYIFRLGGEEFAILLNDTDLKGAELIAERLRTAIESLSILHDDTQFQLTASMGITQYKENDSLGVIMSRSDNALYKAKDSGRNKVVCA